MSSKKKIQENREPRILNRKARHDYHITETLECGVVLTGSEVKSIREGRVNLSESYVSTDRRGELWLLNADIALYPQAGPLGHLPRNKRKLLAHKRELKKWGNWCDIKGNTIVPLAMYFVRGRVKVEIGLGTGKKTHDKRADMRDRDVKRDIQRAMSKKVR